MRILIGGIAVLVSVFLAYIRYEPYKTRLRYNIFFCELVGALVHNNLNEMKPFYAVFEEIYTSLISKRDIKTTEQALEIIENELVCAVNGGEISALIKRWLSSGEGEVNDIQSELTDVCDKALDAAKKRLSESGKSGFVLYPGAVLIALIILI